MPGFLYWNDVMPQQAHTLLHKQSGTSVIHVFRMFILKKKKERIKCIYMHMFIKLDICLLRANFKLTLCHLVLFVGIIDDSHSVFISTE